MNVVDILVPLGITLPTIGGAIAWIWNKIEKRVAALEHEVKSCQGERTVLLAAAEMLYVALKQASPRSPTLSRARQLLDLAGKSLAED